MEHIKKNVVFCDGGLSNRLNALIFALNLMDRYSQDLTISWPLNNWCGARFSNLFETNLAVVNHDLHYFKEREDDYCLIFHENQCGFTNDKINFNSTFQSYDDYEFLIKDARPFLYYNNLIPGFVSIDEIKKALSHLNLNEEIKQQAIKFCNENNINNSVYGLHIRKTDFGNSINDDSLFNTVMNSKEEFFVCSDDKDTNEKFALLPNCHVFEKSFFPEKSKLEASWNEVIVDDQERSFAFNIKRSEDSIIEALIDLLILSQTTQIQTSHSTFLRMSLILKSTNFFSSKR